MMGMKKSISCLTLMLLGIIIPPLFVQLSQDTLQQEVEKLKNRVSELEDKLKAVENVEKMELAAKAQLNKKRAYPLNEPTTD